MYLYMLRYIKHSIASEVVWNARGNGHFVIFFYYILQNFTIIGAVDMKLEPILVILYLFPIQASTVVGFSWGLVTKL